MRIGLALAICLIIAYLVISWFLSNLILHPESSLELTKTEIETEWGTTYEALVQLLPTPTEFSITTFDGLQLKGKYYALNDTPKCVIIGAHGWTSTWAGMLKYVPALADCDCDLVLYDHRGHGNSDTAYPTGGFNEAKDLLSITEWVQQEKEFTDKQVGWLGSSWGAATALIAGADKKKVGFIIVDAPFQDWYAAIFERVIKEYGSWTKILATGIMEIVNWRTGVDYKKASPILAAPHIEEPVLLIHSQMDNSTDSQQSVNISKQLNRQSTFHHLTWGGDHTKDVIINTDKFRGLITEFLKGLDGDFLKK